MDYVVDYDKLCLKYFPWIFYIIENVLAYTKYLRDCDG